MAGDAHSLGTMFVEIDLDPSRYQRTNATLYREATQTVIDLERSFKIIGATSSNTFDLMRQRIENAYAQIRNSSRVTEADIVAAGKARAAQLNAINEQQYGKQISLIDKIRGSLSGMLSATALAAGAMYSLWSGLREIFTGSFKAVDEYRKSIVELAAMVTTFTARAPGETLSGHWQRALTYSREMVPVLEEIAAKTALSGQETIALNNALARQGVFLNANNAEQMEGFTRLSNALPFMTRGQEIMRQINTEIRSVITGQGAASSMLLRTLSDLDPMFEKNLSQWRKSHTELENIGKMLSGFGPASGEIANQWDSISTTLSTVGNRILRDGFSSAYDRIIAYTKELTLWAESHQKQLSGGLVVAWNTVLTVVENAFNMLSGYGPILSDIYDTVIKIAYGWGAIFAALSPITERIGKLIAVVWELASGLGNLVLSFANLATMNFSGIETSLRAMEKNFGAAANGVKEVFTGIGKDIEKSVTDYLAATEEYLKADKAKTDGILKNTGLIGRASKEESEEEKKRTQERLRLYQSVSDDLARHTLTKIELINREIDAYKKQGVAIGANNDFFVRLEVLRIAKIAELRSAAYKEWFSSHQKEAEVLRAGVEAHKRLLDEESAYMRRGNASELEQFIQKQNEKLAIAYDNNRKGVISEAMFAAERVAIEDSIVEATRRDAIARAELSDRLLEGITGAEEMAHAATLRRIDREAEEYQQQGVDRVALAYWVAEQRVAAEESAGERVLSAYETMWNGINELSSGNEGLTKTAEGLRQIVDALVGEDRYKKEIKLAQEHYRALEEQLRGHINREALLRAAGAKRDEAIDRAGSQRRLSMAAGMFGALAGLAMAFYQMTGEQSKGAFRMYQALAIAETIVSTIMAAQDALAWGIKYGGPFGPKLGFAMAAIVTASGLARVAAIASQSVGGGSAGGSAGATAPAISAPSEASPEAPSEAPAFGSQTVSDRPAEPTVHIHIYGNAIGNDEFVRQIVPEIRRAVRDGVY